MYNVHVFGLPYRQGSCEPGIFYSSTLGCLLCEGMGVWGMLFLQTHAGHGNSCMGSPLPNLDWMSPPQFTIHASGLVCRVEIRLVVLSFSIGF